MAEQQITVQDALWLNMDRPNNLMIIDGVMWFLESPDWTAVRDVIEERMIKGFPVFSSKAVKRKDAQYWVPDSKFDLNNHIVMADLPAPVSLAQVQQYISQERSKPLPRTRPLWVFHMIDNVVTEDGRQGAVVMARFHHSIADGIRLVQVMLGLCDPISEESGVAAAVGKGRSRDAETASGGGPLDRAKATAAGLPGKAAMAGLGAVDSLKAAAGTARESGASAASGLAGKVLGAVSDPAGTAKAIPGAVVSAAGAGQSMFDDTLSVVGDPSQLVDAFSALAPLPDEIPNTAASLAKLGLAGTSVKTVWSGKPGNDKSVHWVDAISLDRVKEVGKKTGTTVNDVMISVVAGTLQSYLAEHGDAVDEMMWMVPVSLKPFDPGMPEELGNHFALIAVKLPTNIDDPKARLREVNARINKIKKSHEAVITFGIARGISESPERVGVFLTNFFANKAVGVLTNVPGPRGRLALAGTPVEGVLGWAPASGDEPMTITIFSYNGRVHVGFAVDKKLIPDGHRLPDLFADEARGLYKAVTGKDVVHDVQVVLP